MDIDRIASAASSLLSFVQQLLGICTTPRGIQKYQQEAIGSIIEEIAGGKELGPITRAAIVSEFQQILAKRKNQEDIVRIALEMLEPDAPQRMPDEDWAKVFFDYAKNISTEELKTIWARLLVEQVSSDSQIPKKLLHSIYLMDRSHMELFMRIVPFCFTNAEDYRRVYSCLFLVEKPSFYNQRELYRNSIVTLASFDLVEYNWHSEFVFPKARVELAKGNRRFVIDEPSGKRACYGNVRLTAFGSTLYRAVEDVIDLTCLEFCMNVWKSRQCNITSVI